MKRVAILGSRGIPARYGGFETFAEELATRLAQAGFELTVFGERRRGEARLGHHRGVRLVRMSAPRLGPLSTLLYDLRCLWRARRGYDVVLMLGYGASLFCGLPRSRGTEVWISMDGLEHRRGKWGPLGRAWLRRMEARALSVADRVVFDSEAVRRDVLSRVSGPARAHVIEYGARLDLPRDPGVVESLGLRPRSYYLVVCRIEPENRVLEIVRAVSRAPTTRELIVVGDVERAGPYGEACRRAAGPQVRFLGAVFDRQTLHALRAESWAAIHGHSVGGTNPSLLEALAAGVPVIAHENPFNREVLGDGARTFRDEDELVAAIAAAERASAEDRLAEGERGRRRIQERYTWERIAAEYVRLLSSDERRPPSGDGAPSPAARPEPAGALPVAADVRHAGRR
jgi:glycosyltransferase involved in cell wall biosynthesis